MKSFLVSLFWLLFTSVVAVAQTCPVNTAPPSITGTPQVGQSLNVVPGTWSNSPQVLFYQWFRNTNPPTPIPAETSRSHIVTSADVSFSISVEEVASNQAGADQVMSASTALVTSSSGSITAMNLTSGITSS